MNNRLRNVFLFSLFFALTVVLYFQTLHSKFVFDFVDLVFDFEKRGWGDLGNFSIGVSPYFFAKGILFLILKVIKFNSHAWFILSCALHALNTFLLYRFTKIILNFFEYKNPDTPSLLAAFLFLVSPYNTEVVVWAGAFNYLLVSAFILLHLNLVFAFVKSQKRTHLVYAAITFITAIFSHEWGLFLLPADLCLLFLLSANTNEIPSKKNLWLILFLVVSVCVYFVNQSLHGSVVGHYGAETHLNFTIVSIIPAFCKYLLKILLMFTFFPVPVQEKVYNFIQQPLAVYFLTFLFLSLFLIGIILLWENKKLFGPAALFFILFFLFVFPVLNLYFPYWIKIHADRYCYLPGAFMYSGVLAALFLLKNPLRIILPVSGVILSVYLLLQTNFSWCEAGKLEQQLESNFHWWNAKRVYILNVPDNFRGAYMYRNLQPSAFSGNFIKYNFAKPTTEVIEILNYNLSEKYDSVIVEKTGNSQLKVTLSKWGIWWWSKTVGATDYETERVKVDVDNYNHSYIVEFKQKQEGDVFLYQANGAWRQVQNF